MNFECRLEDLPKAMTDRDGWREREGEREYVHFDDDDEVEKRSWWSFYI